MRGRHGVVLLVVIAMLQLFTLVGIALVYYGSQHDYPTDVIHVVQEIEEAQGDLSLLAERPDDPQLLDRAIASTDAALDDAELLQSRLDAQPDPVLRPLAGQLRAARVVFWKLLDPGER